MKNQQLPTSFLVGTFIALIWLVYRISVLAINDEKDKLKFEKLQKRVENLEQHQIGIYEKT
jgi:hypothetical protein